MKPELSIELRTGIHTNKYMLYVSLITGGKFRDYGIRILDNCFLMFGPEFIGRLEDFRMGVTTIIADIYGTDAHYAGIIINKREHKP